MKNMMHTPGITSFQQKRLWILRMAFLQMLLALLILIVFSNCQPGNQPSNVPVPADQPEATPPDTNSQVHLVDTDYVHIAGHHSPETKQILRSLEAKNFEKGTLAHQLLDYLKSGVNDFGEEFKFIDLRFEGRTAVFHPKFTHEISELADLMSAFPNLKVKIMSYTDNVGGEKANEILSVQRVENIKRELTEKGIAGDRIEIKGYGQKFPVGSNQTHEGRLINNRIELMVLSK